LYSLPNRHELSGYKTLHLSVFFPESIMPGEHLEFSYRFIHPCAFTRGDNTYLAYVENPHKLYRIEVQAEKGLCISNPGVYTEQEDHDAIQPQLLSEKHFVWNRTFPLPKVRYVVFFQLSTASNNVK